MHTIPSTYKVLASIHILLWVKSLCYYYGIRPYPGAACDQAIPRGMFGAFPCCIVSGVGWLTGSERFEECVTFMCQHSLYKEALGVFTDKSSPQYKVCGVFMFAEVT